LSHAEMPMLNNIFAAGQNATTASEHFVHALLNHGCVVPATLGMHWLWSSTTNESAESVFLILKISNSGNDFLSYFCKSDPPNIRMPMKTTR